VCTASKHVATLARSPRKPSSSPEARSGARDPACATHVPPPPLRTAFASWGLRHRSRR